MLHTSAPDHCTPAQSRLCRASQRRTAVYLRCVRRRCAAGNGCIRSDRRWHGRRSTSYSASGCQRRSTLRSSESQCGRQLVTASRIAQRKHKRRTAQIFALSLAHLAALSLGSPTWPLQREHDLRHATYNGQGATYNVQTSSMQCAAVRQAYCTHSCLTAALRRCSASLRRSTASRCTTHRWLCGRTPRRSHLAPLPLSLSPT